MDTVLVEGEGNHDDSGLSVGTDGQGKKYRTILYVDLEEFDIGSCIDVLLVMFLLPRNCTVL